MKVSQRTHPRTHLIKHSLDHKVCQTSVLPVAFQLIQHYVWKAGTRKYVLR